MQRIQTKWRRATTNPPLLTTDSVTQPAMALSVVEILERYRTGRPLPDMTSKTFYDGDLMLPEPHMMDINDREELSDTVTDRIEELNELFEQNARQVASEKAEKEKTEKEKADSTKPS